MAEEELEDWTAARSAYGRYLDLAESGPTREEVRKRLTLIGRNLLRAQAQQALAQEQEITATEQIAPRSVAVLPLAFNSEREDLEPLIYALSDMMITDFKVSNALVVLERARIQTLLDEMALTSAGYADAQTGARAGRLLRAEHVFQGVLTTLGGDELQTDADVLNVPNTSSAGQLTEAAQLERLFDMEKQIVIRTIREVLGVALTPAEEQAILDNRMSNVMAFLRSWSPPARPGQLRGGPGRVRDHDGPGGRSLGGSGVGHGGGRGPHRRFQHEHLRPFGSGRDYGGGGLDPPRPPTLVHHGQPVRHGPG